MTRRSLPQLAAELVMLGMAVGAVLCATPFAVAFALAAIVKGGIQPPEEKSATKRARASNGKANLAL